MITGTHDGFPAQSATVTNTSGQTVQSYQYSLSSIFDVRLLGLPDDDKKVEEDKEEGGNENKRQLGVPDWIADPRHNGAPPE